MALVAYDNSDESDVDEADDVVNDKINLSSSTANANRIASANSIVEEEALEDIVRPGETELALRQQVVPKRKRVQILLPSISQIDSDSDEENNSKPENKKVKAAPSTSKCGLFSMLPSPTVGSQLVPHRLTQTGVPKPQPAKAAPVVKPDLKTVVSVVRAPLQLPKEVHKSTSLSLLQSTEADDDDDDENEPSASFFSLDARPKPVHPLPVDTIGLLSVESPEDLYRFETSMSDPAQNDIQNSGDEADTSERQVWVGDEQPESDDVEPETSVGYNDIIQDEQFLRLCGGKRNLKHAIEIVDVHADDQLRDVDLTKSLTEEVTNVMSHSKKRNKDMPSSQQKRKHQITYLAYKAKEREMELKNQWAENKFNKRQTQSKYGF